MEIGERIKKIRELKNYTQEYMAKNLNMTQAGYSKIERDETELSFQKLGKISEVLKVTIDDIIHFNERMIFNVSYNSHSNNGYVVNNGIPEQERKLYEQIIQQQKDEILFLKKIIEQNNLQ